MKQSEARALIQRRIRIDENGCWIWPTRTGYGEIKIGDKRYAAHRLAWLAYRGRINGKHVLHRCDVPTCVNPDHLFLGTHQDNMTDMVNKDRAGARAHRNPNAKLSDEQIREIRAKFARGVPPSWLADDYGTSIGYMWQICNRWTKGRRYTRHHADLAI